MPTIFISYRRADSASASGRLYDRLTERYGRESVFKDVDSIPPGATFPAYIAQSIQTSDVALVVIGPHWLDASAGFGRRRLDDPADFVRIEIETALKLGVPVIPVLVEGAKLPPARRLPASLRPLLEQNAVALRPDPDFSRDMQRIVEAIDYWVAQPRRETPPDEAPTEPAPAPITPVRPAASATTRPKSAVRSTTAVAEHIGIAARQKRARSQREGRFGRGAQALAATIITVALVVALVAALHGLNRGGASSNSSSGDIAVHRTATVVAATTTALEGLGKQPFTSIGPCDTTSAHQFNYASNHYFWQYDKDRASCLNHSAARLAITSGGIGYSQMTFYGLPYYGDYAVFPSTFTATMTIAFNYSATYASGYPPSSCAAVQWSMPSESSNQWINSLYVCQDSTWHLASGYGAAASNRKPVSISKPFTIKFVVASGSISVMLNGAQALPPTQFIGQIAEFTVTLQDDTPGHSITISNFALTPGAN